MPDMRGIDASAPPISGLDVACRSICDLFGFYLDYITIRYTQ
jgi:hypothetical protein